MKFKELPIEEQEKVLFFHKSLKRDLGCFLGTSLKYKNRQEAANAVASYFRELNPKSVEEFDKFYETCDDYVYENVYCNMERSCVQRTKKIFEVLNNFNIKEVLEIGAGVGAYGMALEKTGIDWNFTKSNNLAFRFLEYRIKKHNSKISRHILSKLV